MLRVLGVLAGVLVLSSCGKVSSIADPQRDGPQGEKSDPPQVAVGERLFRETRFSQLYFATSAGNVNARVSGDPTLEQLPTVGEALENPFSGQTMSCAACHMVDDAKEIAGAGNRAYADFAARTLIPVRDDGTLVTSRNTPTLVGAAASRGVPELFHFDGEFASLEELVVGGWTGRNFGWATSELGLAKAHVAEVLRGDDGTGAIAQEFGGVSYAILLKGEDPAISPEFLLPSELRIDIATSDNAAILRRAAELVVIYLRSLEFVRTSPYDEFLTKNNLPTGPSTGETDAAYTARLAAKVNALRDPKWVSGRFALHDHAFKFGAEELRGLRLFLEPARGNCAACHAPPHFSDFKFHNTGESQDEYDALHGRGAFVALDIPGAAERERNPERYLPASAKNPRARGPFRTVPDASRPGLADLGLWNILFNPDYPAPQSALIELVCGAILCDAETYLPRTVGLFKTPGLRDLGHSGPYLHSGRKTSLEEVVRFYRMQSELSRQGLVRNPDPEIMRAVVSADDIAPISAFLRALDEDYE